MLRQALADFKALIDRGLSVEESLLDIDSTLESLVALALAIRRTGRKSRLYKADRLFRPEEHIEFKRHLECIVILRPGPEVRESNHQYRWKVASLSPLQRHLIDANLRRRNRFIQAQLHSVGLKSRAPVLGLSDTRSNQQQLRKPAAVAPPDAPTPEAPSIVLGPQSDDSFPLPAGSITTATYPTSELEYKEPTQYRTESSPMTVITKITASACYPRPRFESNQRLVRCPCCCQMLSVSEVKNDKAWRSEAPTNDRSSDADVAEKEALERGFTTIYLHF